MKTLNKTLIAIAALTALPALAQECQGNPLNMKAVVLAVPRSGFLVNFTGSGGHLDPVPFPETTINVFGIPGRAVCVAVTFSGQVNPVDNYGVYQVSIDDVPMPGHGSLAAEYGYTTPIVFDAVNQGSYLATTAGGNIILNAANSRMVSYTFFASVMPGLRTIRVRLAGCCSPLPGGIGGVSVRAATLVARY